MRDSAIEGLSVLARREQWRASEYGDAIRSRLETALEDESPVVRMNAAEAFRSLHSDATSGERVNRLRDLLDREDDSNVTLVLLSALGNEARESPTEVDAVLRDLAARAKSKGSPTETTDDQASDEDGTDSDPAAARLDEGSRLNITLITLLALVHRTPFAKETVDNWAANASQSPELLHAIPFIRDYLAPPTYPALQARAFAFVQAVAESALERWSQAHAQPVSETEVSAAERTELENALHVLDTLASQIYFASGAFDEKRSNGTDTEPQPDPPAPAELARFANLAVPVLLTCAGTKAAPVIHHVVETLIFLAPLDEKRGLVALAEAVTANTGYAFDSLAGSVVIPYLTRLLAEERDLVLFEVEGVVAFRTLLSAFASAGNEAALVMAFTFADVFR